ncbi:hypothetical protein ACJX0J_027597, partial [Zea mays]
MTLNIFEINNEKVNRKRICLQDSEQIENSSDMSITIQRIEEPFGWSQQPQSFRDFHYPEIPLLLSNPLKTGGFRARILIFMYRAAWHFNSILIMGLSDFSKLEPLACNNICVNVIWIHLPSAARPGEGGGHDVSAGRAGNARAVDGGEVAGQNLFQETGVLIACTLYRLSEGSYVKTLVLHIQIHLQNNRIEAFHRGPPGHKSISPKISHYGTRNECL